MKPAKALCALMLLLCSATGGAAQDGSDVFWIPAGGGRCDTVCNARGGTAISSAGTAAGWENLFVCAGNPAKSDEAAPRFGFNGGNRSDQNPHRACSIAGDRGGGEEVQNYHCLCVRNQVKVEPTPSAARIKAQTPTGPTR